MAKMTMFNDPQRLLNIANIAYIALAALTVVATFFVVSLGNRVAKHKDAELRAYQTEADARIQEAKLLISEIDAKNIGLLSRLDALQRQQAMHGHDVAELLSAQAHKGNTTPTISRGVLKAKTDFRSITDVERHRFLEAVSLNPRLQQVASRDDEPYAGWLEIWVDVNDKEAYDYAAQLRTLVSGVGWRVDIVGQPYDPKYQSGLYYVHSDLTNTDGRRRSRDATDTVALFSCMQAAGISGTVEVLRREKWIFRSFLVVGKKPPVVIRLPER